MRRLPLIIILFTLSHGSLAASIQALCQETVLRSAYLSDLGDNVDIPELYTDDAVFTLGDFTASGKEAIRNWLTNPRQPRGISHHVVTNHLVTETDGEITGTAYYRLYSTPVGGSTDLADQPQLMGIYHDVYAIEDGVCKFKKRHAEMTFTNKKALEKLMSGLLAR